MGAADARRARADAAMVSNLMSGTLKVACKAALGLA
jgi:hypothetical protein